MEIDQFSLLFYYHFSFFFFSTTKIDFFFTSIRKGEREKSPLELFFNRKISFSLSISHSFLLFVASVGLVLLSHIVMTVVRKNKYSAYTLIIITINIMAFYIITRNNCFLLNTILYLNIFKDSFF